MKIIASLTALLLLAGCAQQHLIVDRKGVDPVQYEQDLQECRGYAGEVDVAGKTATSAAEHAAVGGVLGAIFGDRHTAARAAGGGGVLGGFGGYKQGTREQERVVRNCMIGRGYKVL